MPEDFYLIETMRLDNSGLDNSGLDGRRREGEIALLDLHMDRLQNSAAHFDIPLDSTETRTQIAEAIKSLPKERSHRARLMLHATGNIHITTEPLTPWPEELRFTLRKLPYIENADLLQHKTSRRQAYDAAWRAAKEEGFDEVLFVNTEGWVTEGSRTNLFIKKNNVYYTPPVVCGLLPGVYRRRLLETLPDARERRLTKSDLDAADEIFVCNALRGLRKIKRDENETFRRDFR